MHRKAFAACVHGLRSWLSAPWTWTKLYIGKALETLGRVSGERFLDVADYGVSLQRAAGLKLKGRGH